MFDPLTSSPCPLAISLVTSDGSPSDTVESVSSTITLTAVVLNGLDIDDKFREYFDFEDYWHNNGGETITTNYGMYMVDTKGLAYWLKELAAY